MSEEPITRIVENGDGTRTFYTSADALAAAGMLDYEDAPELSEEEFEELTDEMRKAREEADQEAEQEDAAADGPKQKKGRRSRR